MPDRDGNRSNPYHPNPEMCCEACVFGGTGLHAPFCNWCENCLAPAVSDGCPFCVAILRQVAAAGDTTQ
jgi:hypothetical protein